MLRAGPITREELGGKFGCGARPGGWDGTEAPGQLPSHYRPQTPLTIAGEFSEIARAKWKALRRRCFGATRRSQQTFVESRRLGRDRQTCARRRRICSASCASSIAPELDCIVAEALPEEGLGVAIMDRLRRAAHALGATITLEGTALSVPCRSVVRQSAGPVERSRKRRRASLQSDSSFLALVREAGANESAAKTGCGLFGLLWNSGWSWQARNHG